MMFTFGFCCGMLVGFVMHRITVRRRLRAFESNKINIYSKERREMMIKDNQL